MVYGLRVSRIKNLRYSAIAVVASIAFSITPLAPAWASTTSWGFWVGLDEDGDFYPADLTFDGAGMVNATVTDDSSESYSRRDTLSRYFTSTTPMGSVFGSNGPFAIDQANYIRLRTESTVEITVTFDSAVPAGQLGFALSDFDNDKVTVRAWDDADNPLSGSEIIGSATSNAFNYCDPAFSTLPPSCNQEPDPILVPNVEANSDNVAVTLSTGDGEDSYIGTTAWFRPSVPVTRVSLTQESFTPDVESNIDYWFAQIVSPTSETPETLPATGVDYESIMVAGALIVGAGTWLVALSRRQRGL